MKSPIAFSDGLAVWTLYVREVRRFTKVYTQTIMAPVITTLLFLAVFTLALGRSVEHVAGVPFASFLAPGLVMMAMTQNAFTNTSTSLLISKIQGNIVDTLMPPLTAHDLTLGFALGGATRGVAVGFFVALATAFFVPMSIHNPFFVLFHALGGSLMLSLLGMLAGIWSEKFDHVAAVTNFIVTPLAFLSGTFYSIERLPAFAQVIAHFNPFFYAIDGFRYGFTGHADSNLWAGVIVVGGINAFLWWTCHRLFAMGYKLKS
ncbi:MAG: ABC transporter permease [Magnetospiraceae bacterium]